MAYSTPPTWVAGQVITAAALNILRDCILETPAAKATTSGWHFASTGPNAIAERAILEAIVDTSETTTSATYANLATGGPAVTLTTGTKALVTINAQLSASAAGAYAIANYEVTGATADAANDNRCLLTDNPTTGSASRMSVTALQTLVAGSNTFTMKYRVQTGTGTFLRRRIQVIGL